MSSRSLVCQDLLVEGTADSQFINPVVQHEY